MTTRLAVDPSAFLRLAESRRQPGPHPLVSVAALRSRAMSALYRRVAAGEAYDVDVRATLERITTIKVRLLGDRVSRGNAWRLATELGLPDTEDAEILAVARLQADALVSLDPHLLALADGVVPVAPFEALLSD